MSEPACLAALKAATEAADSVETAFRREAAQRIAALTGARSDAYRRLNLMVEIVRAVSSAKDEAAALTSAASALKAELGWDSDSAARIEVLENFVPLARAVFAAPEDGVATLQALSDFERWYATSRGTSFWTLFDQYSPERPVVDF